MQRPVKRDVLNKPGNMALIFTIVFALLTTPALAQDPKQKDLKAFYQQNCSGCHGIDGAAVGADGKKLKGQDLTDPDWQRNTKDKKMVKAILKGKFFGLAMPKFKDALTEEKARLIVTDIIRGEFGEIPVN